MDIYRQTSACLDYRMYFSSWVLVPSYFAFGTYDIFKYTLRNRID